MSDAPQYMLPPGLVGKADLARVVREVEAIDNELEAQKARARVEGSKDGYHMPNMSRSLDEFLEMNSIDIANDHVRMEFKEQLAKLKNKAPVIHMTFAVEADPEFLRQLLLWVRKEIHPQALISVGLQPALIGGVYLRTPNHVHDFSLRSLLKTKRDIMTQELKEVAGYAG